MQVTITNAHTSLRFPVKEAEHIVRMVLRFEAATASSSISVVFVDHPKTIGLNKRYLRHHRTTDVIAFEYEKVPSIDGEIFVNLDQAKAQSIFYGVTFRAEVRRLIIHGLLHLVGYDDASLKKRKAMIQREDFFLMSLSKQKRKRAT